jgi:hypothetical protein
MACGAYQTISQEKLDSDIPSSVEKSKIITSDDFLKREVFEKQCFMLN